MLRAASFSGMTSRPGAHGHRPNRNLLLNHHQAQPFTAGKYLITPLSRAAANGGYSATVSIRSGQGSGTSDRIYTFEAEFTTREDALLHAAAQGRHWLSDSRAFA